MRTPSFWDDLDAPLTDADYDGYSEAEWAAMITYLHGDGTPAARAVITNRVASDPAFAAALESIRALWQTPLPKPDFDVEAGLQALRASAAALPVVFPTVSPAPTPRASRRAPRRFVVAHWGKLAAVLLLGAIGVHIVQKHRVPAYYYQGGAAGLTAVLPDSTHVTLAPGSYLGTEHGFPHDTRVVYLYGSAHFTVAHHARVPFVVQTLGVGTRVLGTTFAVTADTLLNWQVQVEQGKVSLVVRGADGHWQALRTLTAGEAVHLPIAAAWMAQAGYDLAATGLSIRAAFPIQAALRRAVIHLGARSARGAAPAR